MHMTAARMSCRTRLSGGTAITMGVLQAIVNVVDFGMSMLEAVAAPRFTANSNVIDVSNRIPRFVTDELARRGYPVGSNSPRPLCDTLYSAADHLYAYNASIE